MLEDVHPLHKGVIRSNCAKKKAKKGEKNQKIKKLWQIREQKQTIGSHQLKET